MSETLTWDGEELSGCIVCDDLSPLRAFATRGSNTLYPGRSGRTPNPVRRDQLDVTLAWTVTGRFDPDGLPHADREVGVEQNLEHYRTLFTTGADPDTGEHDISLAYAASVFQGTAQLREYAPVRTGPGTATIITRLSIAAGILEEAGS